MFPFLVGCVGQGKVDDQLLQGTKNFLSHLDKELKGKQTLCGVSFHFTTRDFLTFLKSVQGRGLLNLGKMHLDHQTWESLMQSIRLD